MSIARDEGVLVIAHGTVSDLHDLPQFLERILGRPASQGHVAELRKRYQRIGGSPLYEITKEQARLLSRRLDAPVLLGMRLWRPSIEESLIGAARLSLRKLCVLPLAPFSVHVYRAAAEEALERVAPKLALVPSLVCVEPWGNERAFIRAHADKVARALEQWPGPGRDAAVVLTAHSLPTRVIASGDPYQRQVEACVQAIATSLGQNCELCYQSQGVGGEWLGPDVRSTLERLAGQGRSAVLLVPIGFLAEHLETLYDLDVDAAKYAGELGMELRRVAALNSDQGLIEAMANVVERALGVSNSAGVS
ncbi:MAG TPA: ferrochelatase [Polyangiaceae bacterium]|jgi:ferrochelatase